MSIEDPARERAVPRSSQDSSGCGMTEETMPGIFLTGEEPESRRGVIDMLR